MSKNNTKRRKLKKLINDPGLKLYPHQREALKAMLNKKDVTFNMTPGKVTLLSAAKKLGIALVPSLADSFAAFKVVADRNVVHLETDGNNLIVKSSTETDDDTDTGRARSAAPSVAFGKEFDYDTAELAWTARILALAEEGPTESDQYGSPIWPDWLVLKNGRHPMAGEYGKLCYRTACQRPNAVWWNRGSYHYYCEDCATMLNRENRRDWIQLRDSRPIETRQTGEMCIKLSADDEHPVPR